MNETTEKRTYYQIRPENVEDAIKAIFFNITSKHVLPLPDVRNIKFDHKRSLENALHLSIHATCRKIRGGAIKLTGKVLPQNADPADREQIYVIADCFIERPRG